MMQLQTMQTSSPDTTITKQYKNSYSTNLQGRNVSRDVQLGLYTIGVYKYVILKYFKM